MKLVTLYSADWCNYCARAKKLLASKGVQVEEINVDQKPNLREEIVAKTGMKTIPQIFIGDHFIGGYSELAQLNADGSLDNLLKDDETKG